MYNIEMKRCEKSKLLVDFKWSVEDTFKLITAVRSFYSYETTLDNNYSNEQSWVAVAKKFPNFNANDCKAKWQSLRAQQRRIIRENKVAETKWKYFTTMPPLHPTKIDAPSDSDRVIEDSENDCASIQLNISPVIETDGATLDSSNTIRDEYALFGELVASELRRFPNQDIARSIKLNIHSYLVDSLVKAQVRTQYFHFRY